ncbi:MAG: 50S ribosomal protein L36 [Candidatus Roizmanbacteria bacterium]|nr:50S ribosomal protein L36 [Candidatus Roizmanbacteria bacterium]
MKVKNSLSDSDAKKGDKIVMRRGRLFRINKRNPRRKARQG